MMEENLTNGEEGKFKFSTSRNEKKKKENALKTNRKKYYQPSDLNLNAHKCAYTIYFYGNNVTLYSCTRLTSLPLYCSVIYKIMYTINLYVYRRHYYMFVML